LGRSIVLNNHLEIRDLTADHEDGAHLGDVAAPRLVEDPELLHVAERMFNLDTELVEEPVVPPLGDREVASLEGGVEAGVQLLATVALVSKNCLAKWKAIEEPGVADDREVVDRPAVHVADPADVPVAHADRRLELDAVVVVLARVVLPLQRAPGTLDLDRRGVDDQVRRVEGLGEAGVVGAVREGDLGGGGSERDRKKRLENTDKRTSSSST